MKQSRTVLKELTAAYRAVLRHALVAAAGVAVAMPAMAANVTCSGDACNIAAGDTWNVLTSTGYSGNLSGDGMVLVREGDKTDVFLMLTGDVSEFSGTFASNQHASSDPTHPQNWTPTIVFTKWSPNQTFNLTTTAAAAGNFEFIGGNSVKLASSANQGRVFLNGSALDVASTADKVTHIYTGGNNSHGTAQNLSFAGYNMEMGNLYAGNRGGGTNGDIDTSIRNSKFYGIYSAGENSLVSGDVTLDLENVVAGDRIVGLMAAGGNGSIISGNLTINADNVVAPGIYGQQISMDSTAGKTGVVGNVNINVENSTLNQLRGSTTPHVKPWETWVPEYYISAKGINIDIEDSVITEEIIAVGNYLSAGDVKIDISGNTLVGYTKNADGVYEKTSGADGWIIAGAQRPGARVASTTVNLDTDGVGNEIKIAGDVNIGSRQRSDANNADADSVTGSAALNISGGGAVNVGGDLRAYNVRGDTALNVDDVHLATAGNVAEFNKISVGRDATWNNNGTLTLRDGAVMNSNGVIAGDGAMTLGRGATFNAGVSSVKQQEIVLDGVLNAELRNETEYATFDAQSFTGAGTLNLSVGRVGTYDIFKSAAFNTGNMTVAGNSLFNIELDGNNSVIAAVKPVDEIAATGLTHTASTALFNMAMSSSDVLNELVVRTQDALASGDVAAVEHAAAVVHPTSAPLAQSVASTIQNTVGDLVATRLADMGRKQGDIVYGLSHVWAQGMLNKSKNGDRFEYDMRGVAGGLDMIAGGDVTLGAGYAFSTADTDMTVRDVDIDANTVFLYGQYKPAAWYVNAMLNYTMADFSARGNALGLNVDADRDVDAYGARVAAGYELDGGLTPQVGLRYLHVASDSYRNSADVHVGATDANFLTLAGGAQYAHDFALTPYVSVRPELHAMAKYDIVSQADDISVTMPGVAAYDLTTRRLGRMGGELGAGIGVMWRSLEMGLRYSLDVRRDYTSHTGMLNARYRF